MASTTTKKFHVSTDSLDSAASDLEKFNTALEQLKLPEADEKTFGTQAYTQIEDFIRTWSYGVHEVETSVSQLAVALHEASKTYKNGEATVTTEFLTTGLTATKGKGSGKGKGKTPPKSGTPKKPAPKSPTSTGPTPVNSTAPRSPSQGNVPVPASALANKTKIWGDITQGDIDTIAKEHGWDSAQVADWMNVIKAESNGTTTDTNPGSGAYGIAQMLVDPPSAAGDRAKYYEYGGDPNTVYGQLTAMANYIEKTYKTPAAAWYHEQTEHWY